VGDPSSGLCLGELTLDYEGQELAARGRRWLLMTQDRVGDRSFPLTQEIPGADAGRARATVSIAAGMLAKAELISYLRGQITIPRTPRTRGCHLRMLPHHHR
jgi:hypothetical protein